MIQSDDFRDDPWGWAGNQCGHAMIGLGIVVVADAAGLWWLAQPVAAALVYFVVAEVAMQRLRA